MPNEEEDHKNTSEQENESGASDQQPGIFWRIIHRGVFAGKWIGISLLVVIPLYLIWVNYAGYRDKKRVLQKMKDRDLPAGIRSFQKRLTPKDPGPNGAKYYRAAFILARDLEGPLKKLPGFGYLESDMPKLGEPLPADLKDPISTFLEENQMLFRLLRKGRTFRYLNYDQNLYDLVGLRNTFFSDMNHTPSVASGLALKALHREMEGKPDQSVKLLTHILHLVNSFRYDRSVYTDLLRSTMLMRSTHHVQELISRKTVSAAVLQEYQKLLVQCLQHMDVETSLKMELARNATVLKHIGVYTGQAIYEFNLVSNASVDVDDDFSWNFTFQKDDRTYWKKWSDYCWNLWVRLYSTVAPGHYESALATEMDSLIDVLEKLQRNRIRTINDLRLNDDSMSSSNGPYSDSLRSLLGHWLTNQTMVRVTKLALSLEQFRIEHGRWPADRGKLNQEWFSDPYGDGPIKYRKLENGVVVYSVGEDGNDDGGLQRWISDERKDITFRLLDPQVRGKKPDLDPSPESSGDASDSKK